VARCAEHLRRTRARLQYLAQAVRSQIVTFACAGKFVLQRCCAISYKELAKEGEEKEKGIQKVKEGERG
jgi:hypothetical protein